MYFFQTELDNLAATWNTHSIASKNNAIRGGNRPLMMYTLPELYNVDDRLCPVDEDEIVMCEEESVGKPDFPCDKTIKELCLLLLEENNLDFPRDAKEAKFVYKELRRKIRVLL